MIAVHDPADPRLDEYRHLNDTAHRRDFETRLGIFVGEGVTVVQRMLDGGAVVRSVLCLASRTERISVPPGVPVFVASREMLTAVVGFDLHRGVVAIGERPTAAHVDDLMRVSSLAVLEGINDHENLGAIIRAAAALGMDGILADPTTADPWYRRSVRVSMGAVLQIPIARADPWAATLDALARAGFLLVALTPAEEAIPIDQMRVPAGARPAILLGAEGPGLSDDAVQAAHLRVRIPMSRGMDSLNVGQAAAVAFHHFGGHGHGCEWADRHRRDAHGPEEQ